MRRAPFAGALAAAVLIGCGQQGPPHAEEADRTINITMRDNEFAPDKVTVSAGETVTFRFVNRGKVAHEAFIGDEAAQDDHEKEMQAAANDPHAEHGDDHAGLTVESGDSGTLTHEFPERGSTLIGCHEPGHYEDGMVVRVEVR